MEVQIFGIRKNSETRKALRFFAERRVKAHFVDLQERAASPGELRRFWTEMGTGRASSKPAPTAAGSEAAATLAATVGRRRPRLRGRA